MKKGFPKTILGIEIGWKERGRVGGDYKGSGMYSYTTHKLCSTIARIGLEDGRAFLYCPKCLIKLKSRKEH